MMLNIKAAELKQNSLMLVPVIVTLGFVFWLQLFVLFNTDFNILTTNFFNLSFFVEFSSSYNISKFLSWLFLPQNIASLGQMLFGVNSFEFLLTSLILFVAMVSSIALTLDKQFSAKTQKTLFQILTHQSDVIQSYR
jgi:NADH:ubiquinone oxidoreductase subunit 6 (subunit J)